MNWFPGSLRTLAAVAMLASGSFEASAAPAVGEWTQYGNGPEHNGYYPRTIGSAPFQTSWKRTFPASVNQVVVSGDFLYGTLDAYFGSGQKAFALNAADGTDKWNFPLAEGFSVNPPSYANGRVYFQRCDHADDTHLWCLDASSGTLIWAAPHDAQWERYMAPTIANGGVYVNGGYYGGMYGFDATTGAQKFFVDLAQEDGWTPAYANGTLYTCVSGNLLASSPATGSALWSRSLSAPTSWYEGDVPIVYDNKIVVRGPGRVQVVDASSKTQLWYADAAFTGNPAVVDGIVYVPLGNSVKAYDLTNGAVLGTYLASSSTTPPPGQTLSLLGQPLVTKDLVIASASTSTFVFDRASFAQRQQLPDGGLLSYACGRLYIASSNATNYSSSGSGYAIATYTVAASELDPPAANPTPRPDPQPQPNPNRTLGSATAAWLDATRSGNVAYFLFDSPAKIERYDLNAAAWLTPISLPSGPKAFTVSGPSIYVAFGMSVSAFPLDGSTETILGSVPFTIGSVTELNGKLYLGDTGGAKFSVMNETSGTIAASANFFYSATGFSLAATKSKLFSVSTGVSPSDILQIPVNADGSMGAQKDSPYHGDYPTGTKTFVFGGDARVATNAGIVYATGDLSYLGSLAGSFTDGDFSGNSPVILRGNTLYGYSTGLLESGRKTLSGSPLRVFVANASITTFAFTSGRGAVQTVTPLSDLVPPSPGPGIDPTNLTYTPDSVELGNGGVIYLLSKVNQSIFRWSISDRRYLSTIPLADVPQRMAYSSALNRVYLSYADGRITKTDLNGATFSEVPFANSPLAVNGLTAVGEFLFTEDASGAWATHYIYSSAGALLSSKDWNYYSKEYIWNEANRKMYFFRDDTSPNDVIWENVDTEGKLGAEQDSPYHGDYVIQHPLRVSPDGTQVVLGNGDVYAGVSLQRLWTLGVSIADAAWLNGSLITANSAGALQQWNSSYQTVASGSVSGTPVRMFALADGLEVVVQTSHGVRFAKLGADLQIVTVDPAAQTTPPIPTTTAATQVTATSALLHGTVNPRGLAGTWSFEYGQTSDFGSQTTAVSYAASASTVTAAQTLTGLQPNTTYHYRIVATNTDGTVKGSEMTFQTTLPMPGITGVTVTGLTETGAQINATIQGYGANTQALVQYGISSSTLNQQTALTAIGLPGSPNAFQQALTDLLPGTTYYYRVFATSTAGTSYSLVSSFKTAGLPPTFVLTGEATDVTSTSVVLRGTVVPAGRETYAHFVVTPAGGSAISTTEIYVGAGSLPVPVQVRLSGLTPGQAYQFQLVATNPSGTVSGDASQFTTLGGGGGGDNSTLQAVDDRVLVSGRSATVIDVLANDVVPTGANVQITSVTSPANGAAVITGGTITYTPVHAGVVDTFTYTIAGGGQSSTATVTVRPNLLELAGVYQGIVGSDSNTFDHSGSITIVVTPGGTFTGVLMLGRDTNRFHGKLGADFAATITLSTKPGSTVLSLQLDPEDSRITGTVTFGITELPFTATRRANSEQAKPLAGRYTMLLPSADSNAVGVGTGFGVVTITAQGAAKVTGRAGDGSVFAARAFVTADGQLPLYALMGARRNGSLHGKAQFRNLPNVSDFDGSVGLSKAGTAEAGTPPAQLFALVGSRYTPPTRSRAGANTAGSLKLDVTTSSGSTLPLGSGTLSQSGSLTVSGASITFQSTTGTFAGKVMVSGAWQRVSGVVLQLSNTGGGLVLPQASDASALCGSLMLTPVVP